MSKSQAAVLTCNCTYILLFLTDFFSNLYRVFHAKAVLKAVDRYKNPNEDLFKSQTFDTSFFFFVNYHSTCEDAIQFKRKCLGRYKITIE